MLRRSHILTTAALLAVCATPASAAMSEDLQSDGAASGEYQDLRSPDTVDAAEHRGLHAADSGQYALNRDYGSPDAADAARDLPSVTAGTHAGPGPYTDSERKLVASPEVQGMVRGAIREIRQAPTVIAVGDPSAGFDWGDAGIGAAGMLALFSAAAGAALLLSGRRRRRGVGVATR